MVALTECDVPAITKALTDSNPLVRKAAVTGCETVFKHSPDVVKNSDLINKLYGQIKVS